LNPVPAGTELGAGRKSKGGNRKTSNPVTRPAAHGPNLNACRAGICFPPEQSRPVALVRAFQKSDRYPKVERFALCYHHHNRKDCLKKHSLFPNPATMGHFRP
jgi:hypothetical protein